MSYTPIDLTQPNTDVGTTRQTATDKTRTNIQAVRDMVVAGGMPYGWNMSLVGADISQPDQYVFAHSAERIKVVNTWGSSGGADGNPTKCAFYYSADSGTNYDPMVDDLGNYVVTMAYDTSGICTSSTWGATP